MTKLIRLKYVAKLFYGDSLPKEQSIDGKYSVFGSNGPYANIDYPNTDSPVIIIGRKGSHGKINWSSEKCFASDTTFFIDKRSTKYDLRWLYYVLQTLNLDEESGEAAVPGLNRDFAYEKRLFLFSTSYQKKIASFLDMEVERIDKLINAKSKFLQFSSERRQALITHTITKGLNPKIKFKNSGIDWLGDIPSTWQVKKAKYVTSKIGSGVTPKGGAEVYQQQGIPLFRSQNIHFDGLKLDDIVHIDSETHDSMSNSKIKPGDVLLNITGASIGRCYYYEGQYAEANVNQHVCIIRPNAKILTKYLYYFLMSDIGQMQISMSQVGGGREGLTFESIKSFFIPLPGISDQKDLIILLENYIARLEALEKYTSRSIELLVERKSALITEAVTGQIKL